MVVVLIPHITKTLKMKNISRLMGSFRK